MEFVSSPQWCDHHRRPWQLCSSRHRRYNFFVYSASTARPPHCLCCPQAQASSSSLWDHTICCPRRPPASCIAATTNFWWSISVLYHKRRPSLLCYALAGASGTPYRPRASSKLEQKRGRDDKARAQLWRHGHPGQRSVPLLGRLQPRLPHVRHGCGRQPPAPPVRAAARTVSNKSQYDHQRHARCRCWGVDRRRAGRQLRFHGDLQDPESSQHGLGKE